VGSLFYYLDIAVFPLFLSLRRDSFFAVNVGWFLLLNFFSPPRRLSIWPSFVEPQRLSKFLVPLRPGLHRLRASPRGVVFYLVSLDLSHSRPLPRLHFLQQARGHCLRGNGEEGSSVERQPRKITLMVAATDGAPPRLCRFVSAPGCTHGRDP